MVGVMWAAKNHLSSSRVIIYPVLVFITNKQQVAVIYSGGIAPNPVTFSQDFNSTVTLNIKAWQWDQLTCQPMEQIIMFNIIVVFSLLDLDNEVEMGTQSLDDILSKKNDPNILQGNVPHSSLSSFSSVTTVINSNGVSENN